MGQNELGKIFNMVDRSCLFLLSVGQSDFNHTKTIVITEKNLLKNTFRNEKTAANKILPQRGGFVANNASASFYVCAVWKVGASNFHCGNTQTVSSNCIYPDVQFR